MQELEMNRLFQEFETVFPNAYIRLTDHTAKILLENQVTWDCPADPPTCRNYKEILTLTGKGNRAVHKLSFPIPPINQIAIYLPASEFKDIMTAAKMTDSIIQLFLSSPTQTAQTARQNNMLLLLDHLLHPTFTADYTYPALLATELGIDISLSRAVCIFQLDYETSNAASKAQIAHSIYQTIRNFVSSSYKQDILGSFGSSEIILCHMMEPDQTADARFLEQLYLYINKNYPVQCSISIGLTVTGIENYPASLESARAAFRYSGNRTKREQRIYYVTDFLVEHLVYEIPDEVFKHFFKKELNYLHSNDTALETIKALIDHNMDIVPAAESLFIHRNTMVFRLNQLKKQLQLNPLHRDNDRFRLILLYHYYIKKYPSQEPGKKEKGFAQ